MNKTLILYNYYSYSPAVDYFMTYGVSEEADVDYAFVINDPNEDSKEFRAKELFDLNLPNVKFFHRENEGKDFGAYSYLLNLLKNDGLLDQYDYFVFINQTMMGPFFPMWYDQKDHWSRIFTGMIDEEVKLCGPTINCHFMSSDAFMPHVQSMFLATDRAGLDIAVEDGVFDADNVVKRHFDIIMQREIGFSRAIIQSGHNIACLMPAYAGHDFRDGPPEEPNNDPWSENSYFSTSLHPHDTIFFKINRRFGEKTLSNLIKWQERQLQLSS